MPPIRILRPMLAVWLACVTCAGRDQQVPVFRVQSELVLVPVVVTYKSGTHVPDLKQEDFVVTENGERQKIALFEAVTTQPRSPQRQNGTPGEANNVVQSADSPRRLTIILLDLLNTGFVAQDRARNEILKFLSEKLEPGEPVALMVLGDHGLQVIHDFTSDSALLSAALRKVSPRPSAEEQSQAFGQSVSQMSSFSVLVRRLGDFRRGLDIYTPQFDSTDALMERLLVAPQTNRRASLTLATLRQIGDAFAGVPGRKALIWATGGVPFMSSEPPRVGSVHNFGVDQSLLFKLYESAWTALSNANVAVYPLDLHTVINPQYLDPRFPYRSRHYAEPHTSTWNLEEFAARTGGRLCIAKMDADACLRMAAQDFVQYYSLGYYTSSRQGKPGWRRIRVQVLRPGVKVQARSGYYVRSLPSSPQESAQLEIDLALFSPLESTGLPLRVRNNLTGLRDGKEHVELQFEIDGPAITVDEADRNHMSVRFIALAVDETGKPLGAEHWDAEGNLSAESAAQIRSGGVKYDAALDLASGEYTLRFLARDNLSGRIGTVFAPLKITTAPK